MKRLYYFLAVLAPICVFGIIPANAQTAVDLGLSVKWASCNIGASSPEEYGDYYTWGETETKPTYTEETSTWYGTSSANLKSKGVIDDKGNLTAKYDVATVKWGGSWRIPTTDEIDELIKKCTWTWTTENDVVGYKVTGSNGNSIFLPAAGYLSSKSSDKGKRGHYLSSRINGDGTGVFHLGTNSDESYWGDFYACLGLTVRPVSK